jgi:microsomal dipeptidase-like Zn-dependent dipeptidase
MAVVLGIETSNLFNCFLFPSNDMPICDEDYVINALDDYHARGVRVLFPVHKYDNAFSAGDGDRDFIELGNFINSGHWSNFTTVDCPDVPTVFDKGNVYFGGLNQPRNEYVSPPPIDMNEFENNPLLTLTPHLFRIVEESLNGDYCQNAGLTPLGEFLLSEMMKRGMIIEVDHFPRRSYARVMEILESNDYPAAGTHGTNGPDGLLYALGGISKTTIGRCRDPERPGAMLDNLRSRIALIQERGGYPGEGIGLDLNGFAGAPGPRFGKNSNCDTPQEAPVTYPFISYAGDVTFTPPRVGNRVIDFNTEGLAHIGLLPELIEDIRKDAASDADLEPLFRSAEAYIRMWERSEARGAQLREGE